MGRRFLAAPADRESPGAAPAPADPAVGCEDLFRIAFDSANIGMALVAPSGRWLRVNQSLCEITGYSVAELLERDFQSITHPDDVDTDVQYVQTTVAGTISNYEMEKRYLHKDGRVVWVILTTSLVRDGDGQPLYFISQVQDITRRKAAEQAVRQSEQRYRALVENFPNGSIYLFDHDLRGILVDGTGFQSMGFTKQMLEGKTIWEAFPPQVCAMLEPPCRAALRGESCKHEVAFGGQIFEVDFLPIRGKEGKVICGMGMTQNITKRKQAEQRLADQLAELQRWQRVTVGREERIQQLKREVNALRQRLGEAPSYDSPDAEDESARES